MRAWSSLVALAVLCGAGAARAEGESPPKPVPEDAQCKPLPPVSKAYFKPGEELDFDIDVLAANAAHMEVVTMPMEKGTLPVRVRIKTNTFFNKVRKVKAEAKSYLRPKDLHPTRYTEDAYEDDDRRVADVDFWPKNQPASTVAVKFANNPSGPGSYMTVYDRYAHDALDVVGATYYIRSMDLKPGMPLCFDVYAMRTLWRVWGKVDGIEKVPSPLGEVDAYHIVGTSARLDDRNFQREIHVWVTADDRRIPVGAMGVIDLGAVRATLTHAGRVDDAQGKQSHIRGLDW